MRCGSWTALGGRHFPERSIGLLVPMSTNLTDTYRNDLTGGCTMCKDDFRMRLTAASYWAWRAMQRYVIDKLPPEFRYEITFRKDVGGGKVGSILQVDDAIEKIMKADKVPVWIDIMVDRVENRTTVFSLECSDEYESDESKLYYTWSGSAPFGIKCGHCPQEWLVGELRGILPRMKFRLCPTFWNRLADFLFLRWLFCRLDPELVAAHAKISNQRTSHARI